MSAGKLRLVTDAKIGNERKITIPKDVHHLIFDGSNDEDERYFWSVDNEEKAIILSSSTLNEEQSNFKDDSDEHTDGRRTGVPKRIRDDFGIEEGDSLHFIALETQRTPAVYVWTFEQLEEAIISGSNGGTGPSLHVPRF